MAKCRSCDADIVWLKTAAGKDMPVDAASASPEDQVFDAKKHKPHWATCPNADRHRKPR